MTRAVSLCGGAVSTLFLALVVDIDYGVSVTVLVLLGAVLLLSLPQGRGLLPAFVFVVVGAGQLFYDFALWRYVSGSAPFESGLPIYAIAALSALGALVIAGLALRLERTEFRVPLSILSLVAWAWLLVVTAFMFIVLSIP